MRIALLAMWVCAGALVTTAVLSLAVRLAGAVRNRRVTRYEQQTRDSLAAFAAGASDEPPPPPQSALERRLIQRDLVALRPKLKGQAAARVAELFASYGLVDGARRDLRSRSVLLQVRAADALGTVGARQAVPDLIEVLGAGDRAIRLAAARALANLDAPEAVPAILEALSDIGAHAEEVAEALAGFGAPAVAPLRERLRDSPSSGQRRLAAVVLGDLRALEAAADLRAVLSDSHPGVACAAAHAVARLGDVAAVPTLVEILRGAGDLELREAAADALGAIDDPAAAPALIEALDAPEWPLRDAAARALVALGDAGLGAIVDALDDIGDRGVAHFGGLLDVADRLAPLIARAGLGDLDLQRLVRRLEAVGVHARLRELASADEPLATFARSVLAEGDDVRMAGGT